MGGHPHRADATWSGGQPALRHPAVPLGSIRARTPTAGNGGPRNVNAMVWVVRGRIANDGAGSRFSLLHVRLVAMGVLVVVCLVLSTTRSSGQARLTLTAVAAVGPIVVPEHRYGMAIAPDGTLYVIDSARDEVLRLTSDGQFQVVAGGGRRGFSGDRGQAIDTAIDVESDSGIAVARNGTVYFADTSNGRVREVLSDGVIETVIGGGSTTIAQGALPAREVSLSKQFTATSLAIGPGGDLYVAAGPVYRLGRNGQLQWVVGKDIRPPKDWAGGYANPAVQLDFASSSRIAFDGRGDLLDA